MNPMRLWADWLQSATCGAAPADPLSLYRQWLQLWQPVAQAPGTRAAGGPTDFAAALNPMALWLRWLEALPLLALAPAAFVPPLPTAPNPAALDPFGLAARWRAMLEAASGQAQTQQAQTPGAEPGAVPPDPWTLVRQWYDEANALWSKPLEQTLGSEAFAQAAGGSLEGIATATRAFGRAAEEQLKALHMPSRADVARVASLVVQLEDKVDHIEEALEDAGDRAADLARAETVAALDARLSRVEAKLDRLLAALEQRELAEPISPPSPASTAPASAAAAAKASGSARAHKPSTTRTRRKTGGA